LTSRAERRGTLLGTTARFRGPGFSADAAGEFSAGLLEPLASVSLFVVVLTRQAERLALVGDVVLVSVLLDSPGGVVPAPALVAVVRVRPESGEIGGRIVAVSGHEALELCFDLVSDDAEAREFLAVLVRVLVVGPLLAAGDFERVLGVVELALQVLHPALDTESFGGPLASVADRMPRIQDVEALLLAAARVFEVVATVLERSDVRGRIVRLHSDDAFQILAFVVEMVQILIEHPAFERLAVDTPIDCECLGVTDPQRGRQRVDWRADRLGRVLLVLACGLFNEVDAIVRAAS
jgi:hypothetical protein